MRDYTAQGLIDAIKDHPAVLNAAVTGSLARAAADRFSDVDALLITRNVEAVSDVRSWLPGAEHILVCAFHLSHYCSVLFDDFHKLDLAIFGADDPPSRWVIQDYQIIKGDEHFALRLAAAAEVTKQETAAHLNQDVCINNILLLLATAHARVCRGEELGAHAFVAMAIDMTIALETRQRGVDPEADLLDPRRRCERRWPAVGVLLQDCLFVPPGVGVTRLVHYLESAHAGELLEDQRKVLRWLAGV